MQVLSTVYLINTKNLSELQYSTFPLVEFSLSRVFPLVEFSLSRVFPLVEFPLVEFSLSRVSSQSNLKQEEILNLY